MSIYTKFPKTKFPFKLSVVGACLAYGLYHWDVERKRYEFMRRFREKQELVREQSKEIEGRISANLKDFNGNPIKIDDENYEYKSLFYGDFQTFFSIYKAFTENLPRYKTKHIYITDSEKTRDVMTNIMKVQLENTSYAFENADKIPEYGIKKNALYFLNQNNEVINIAEVIPKDEVSILKGIKLTQLKINKELDKKFLNKFDFNVARKT